MMRLLTLRFRDGSSLWWCKEHKGFYNPLKNGYRVGAKQPKHDAIPLDDLTYHMRAAEAWVLTHIPPSHRPVILGVHLYKERKNVRR